MKTWKVIVPQQEFIIQLDDEDDEKYELFDKVLDEGIQYSWEEQSELSEVK